MRILLVALFALSMIAEALAHSWYPIECCSGHDCHEATRVEKVDEGTRLFFLTDEADLKHATVPHNFAWQESPDGKWHVCVTATGTVRCAFRPKNLDPNA